jgi:hypothetical protein
VPVARERCRAVFKSVEVEVDAGWRVPRRIGVTTVRDPDVEIENEVTFPARAV